ncbi:serine/threonine-protein kinase HAL4/sat4 [Penicillium citrinum]|uniref:non-specific serine/threonine protein kinase n=1 Tax=Penicillium citrinum TaxID=5077 RepID=A0A9W9TTE8_PENCI|nr:serine/threonine-protein kinase HAL4/sat4 [Penicillium citrinum]KAJ5240562.1 serine/threonine-protein kinase HAL4/sat4 [Penicillium citrinum]
MFERSRELLETVFQLCIFHPKRDTEPLSDASLDRPLVAHSPTNFELRSEDHRPHSPSVRVTGSPAEAGDGDFLPRNEIHRHFQKSPRAKIRLFRKTREANATSWRFCQKEKNSARSKSEWEKLETVLQTGEFASERRKVLSQKYGDICDMIGHGSSATIFLSCKSQEWHPSIRSFYVIKFFRHQPGMSEAAYRKPIDAEFSISSSLRHRNIVRTFDLINIYGDNICEVLEYCSGGDLHSLLAAKGPLKNEEADCFLKQLMRGVNYLHEMGIAHRDLKPENLLVTENGDLKITDFGTAECFRLAWETDIHMSITRRGSRPYVSPEQYLSKAFDPRRADIWAAAVTYIAMRTGRLMWMVATAEDENFRDYTADRQIGRGYYLIEDTCFKVASRYIIYSMLDANYTSRPLSSDVLHSQWLQGIEVCTDTEHGKAQKDY